jgi:putative FmdB family regulatory protein
MPNYDFECKECGKVFTVRKSMNEKIEPACPVCESPNVVRLWNNINMGNSGGCGSCSSGGSCGGGCGCG